MVAILEAKARAGAAINCVTIESVFATETAVPPQLRLRVSDGWIDQLTVYRWAAERIYPSSWELSESAFVLVTPGKLVHGPRRLGRRRLRGGHHPAAQSGRAQRP